jgi:uncharacterized protein YjiS (DUF1127 family)
MQQMQHITEGRYRMTSLTSISQTVLRLDRPVLLAARLSAMAAARRQRAQLARLDDAALRDIGRSRSEALHEARRPLWDVPPTWRC